jgi:FAD/FMN-containing dehydrogenase
VTALSELSIRGRVATSDDADWDEARQAWNLAADQRPSVVALVDGSDDVSKAVGFARDNGLRVTAQGTGHGAMALGSLDDVILIKTERMRGVELEDGGARVEAGAWAADLGEAAAKTGHSFLPGTSPNVGVTGYTLGGGLSWLGRKYGWACNRVRAIELVTAEGEARTVDARPTPTSSGRCAGVAAGTRWSRRCTWSCCRSRRLTPVLSSSRQSWRRTESGPIATGRRARRRRQEAWSAC